MVNEQGGNMGNGKWAGRVHGECRGMDGVIMTDCNGSHSLAHFQMGFKPVQISKGTWMRCGDGEVQKGVKGDMHA